MREFAVVTEVRGEGATEEVRVKPLLTTACIMCRTGCFRQGKPFLVKNSARLPVKRGTAVRIGLPRLTRALHGFLAFTVPLACAVAGWFAAPSLAAVLPLQFLREMDGESVRALFVMAFLAVSSGIAFAASRSSIHFTTPEIISLM